MHSLDDGLLGGYRVVRRLGVGTRSEVWLGRAPNDDEGIRAVALKAFRPEASTESIDRELAVLESIVHPHVVQLRDLASGPHRRPILVLERLGHESLASLVTHRPSLAAGEVVTILAPLIAAVGAMHSSAVAHGSISASRVLFRDTGAPVLCGLGHVERLSGTTAVALASSEHVIRDRAALARLASGLLSRVEGDEARHLVTWLQRRTFDGSPENIADELVARLFDLADATPVRFDRDARDEPETTIPLRVHRAEPIAAEPEPARETMTLSPRVAVEKVRELVNDRRIPPIVRRRPVLVAMGFAVVLTIVVLAMPTGSAEPVSPGEARASPTPRATVSAVSSDDPIAALAALLQLRAACIRDLSILCLDGVVQPGSAALDDDVALIRGIEAGEVSGAIAEVDPSGIAVTERMGGAALLEYTRGPNSEPASTLLVKGEAGWRIRDYLEG